MSDRPLVERLDHLVLTVSDVEATTRWYERVLGLERETFDGERIALRFGDQKLNLHPAAAPLAPHAARAQPGTADICFITSSRLTEICGWLQEQGVVVELGPITQTGACGPMESIYIRDPDRNLIEIACYDDA